MQSPKVFDPLTKLQCCPTSDGAAAAIVCSENFVVRHGLFDQAIEILGMEMATDMPSSFNGSAMTLVSKQKLFYVLVYFLYDLKQRLRAFEFPFRLATT